MTLAGSARRWRPTGWRLGSANLRSGASLLVAVPLGWTLASLALAVSPNRIWFWVRSRGSILAMQAVNADKEACGVGVYPGDMWWRAAGYSGLRPDVPLFDAGETGRTRSLPRPITTCSPAATEPELKHPVDLLADFASFGYQQLKCWTDPIDRTMLMERMCLWRRSGTCDSASGKPLTPDSEKLLRS